MRGVLVADFGRRSVAMPSGLTIMDSTAAVTGGHCYLRVGRSRDPRHSAEIWRPNSIRF